MTATLSSAESRRCSRDCSACRRACFVLRIVSSMLLNLRPPSLSTSDKSLCNCSNFFSKYSFLWSKSPSFVFCKNFSKIPPSGSALKKACAFCHEAEMSRYCERTIPITMKKTSVKRRLIMFVFSSSNSKSSNSKCNQFYNPKLSFVFSAEFCKFSIAFCVSSSA